MKTEEAFVRLVVTVDRHTHQLCHQVCVCGCVCVTPLNLTTLLSPGNRFNGETRRWPRPSHCEAAAWRLITCQDSAPVINGLFSCVCVFCPPPASAKAGSPLAWTVSASGQCGRTAQKEKETGSNYLENLGLSSCLVHLNRIPIFASY